MDFQQLLAKMVELDQAVPETITQEEVPVLDEPVEECPGDMSNVGTPVAPAAPSAPEPSMSLNLNAQGLDNIEDILKLVAKVNPDMPEPAATTLPAIPPATPAAPLSLPTIDTDDNNDSEKKEWANEPDEETKDVDYMVNKLAGGMNRPKGTHPKVAGGDNPMQRVKEGSDLRAEIRAELLQRLAEAKGAK